MSSLSLPRMKMLRLKFAIVWWPCDRDIKIYQDFEQTKRNKKTHYRRKTVGKFRSSNQQ